MRDMADVMKQNINVFILIWMTTTYIKYAGIPHDCTKCKQELFDHE